MVDVSVLKLEASDENKEMRWVYCSKTHRECKDLWYKNKCKTASFVD